MTMEELMKLPEPERLEMFKIFFNVRKQSDKAPTTEEALL